MSTETLEKDPILETDFVQEVIRQLRALDTFGARDGASDHQLLERLLLTRERLREIPMVGMPDAEAMTRLQVFYNALAALIERECGRVACPMIQVNAEGFGRVIVSVGKLLVLDRALRDVHRFGFEDLSRMKTEADKQLAVALNILGDHPKAAGI